MGRRRAIALVAGREVRDRLHRRSYWVVSALLVLAILAIGVGVRLLGDTGPSPIGVAVTGSQSQQVAAAFQAGGGTDDRPIEARTPKSEKSARSLLNNDEVDVILDTDRGRATFEGTVDETTVAALLPTWTRYQLHRNLDAVGLSGDQISNALSIRPLTTTSLDVETSASGPGPLSGLLASILLYISLQLFGGQILGGVAEEKSSAVIEVLLARLRPDELLAGKVLGIGLVALAQFVAMVIAGLIALAISGATISASIWTAVPLTLVWFLGGFALYAMAFALAGSLVSRQEDAQGAATPVMVALTGAYILVFIIGANPGSMVARVLSVLPPTSPLLMPMRMAAGSASIFEVFVALALLALGVLLVWRFTARVYSQVLLRRGSRISWSAAWAIARGRRL